MRLHLTLMSKQLEDIMLALVNYSNMSEEEVKKNIAETFYVDLDLVNKYEIVIAYLGDDSVYEEYSFFLLRNKETGVLFENQASHCSCSGFEQQFDPKETTLTYLKSEHFYFNGLSEEVKEFIKTLE